MDKKAKDIHYKQAGLVGASGTLQHALEEAVKHLPMSNDRLELLGVNANERRVLLHPRHHDAMLCLTMSSYVQGTQQPIVGIAPKHKDWPIHQVNPPQLAGADKTEFLDGYLYFGVWKNHVVFLPTRSCGSEQLEDHLNWLLRKCPHWPEKGLVSLNDRSPSEYRDKKFKHVQALKLDVPLNGQPTQQPIDGGRQATGSKTVQIPTVKATLEGIRNFVMQLGGKLPEDLLIEDTFDPNDMHVKLEVTCRKKGLERSGPLLDVLANSLRHIHTDLVRFKFEDGTELKGSDLKTQKQVRLECSGNMPVPTQVDKAMHIYLRELVDSGTIV